MNPIKEMKMPIPIFRCIIGAIVGAIIGWLLNKVTSWMWTGRVYRWRARKEFDRAFNQN